MPQPKRPVEAQNGIRAYLRQRQHEAERGIPAYLRQLKPRNPKTGLMKRPGSSWTKLKQ